MRFFLSVLLFLSSCCCAPAMISNKAIETIPMSYEQLVERKQMDRNSAVLVTDVGEYRGHGSGSYVKYKGHHLVTTASHVLNGDDTSLIHGPSYTVMGEVVYDDPQSDIAVMLVPPLKDRIPVKLNLNVRTPSIDAHMHFSGFPNVVNLMSFNGYVAGYNGSRLLVHSYGWPGLSGAGVLTDNGTLVGIAVAVKADSGVVLNEEMEVVGTSLIIVEDILFVTKIQNISEKKLDGGIKRALRSAYFDNL